MSPLPQLPLPWRTRLSDHFTVDEFACKCGRWPKCTLRRPSPRLISCLETARARHYPDGLVILSGVRCKTHNTAVGGAPQSQHVTGKAADLKTPRMKISEAIACGFTGIGVNRSPRGWVVSHVDVRAGSSPVVWEYPSRDVLPRSQWN